MGSVVYTKTESQGELSVIESYSFEEYADFLDFLKGSFDDVESIQNTKVVFTEENK